jgi:hypothetical protein
MRDSLVKLSGGELLRSPLLFPVSALVIATITGMSGKLWAYLPRDWTTTFSLPIAGAVVIVAILMSLRSKCPLRSSSAGLCILTAMCVDLVPSIGYQTGLLSGVLLAQIGLLAAASLRSLVRLEKAVLWILATFVQSVWIHDVLTIGKHISFFGPTIIR